MARRLLALFGEQSFIFVQDLNTSFHNVQKTPLTRSGFETMFLHCIKSARFDARLHETPLKRLDVKILCAVFNITFFNIWLMTSVTRAQPHGTRPAVFRGENTASSPNSGWIPSLPQLRTRKFLISRNSQFNFESNVCNAIPFKIIKKATIILL